MSALGDANKPEIFDTSYLFQVFGALLLVFGALFGLAFLLKRVNAVPMTGRKSIQVLGAVKVGTREKVLLVAAGKQQLLLGVAAGSVRTLHIFEDPVDEPVENQPGRQGSFSSLLNATVIAGKKS